MLHLICFGLRMQMKLPLADILTMFHHSLGSLSRFGRLRVQKQNDFHFNISMKSHIMNISQDSKLPNLQPNLHAR